MVDLDRSWQWLKAGFLKKSTEGFIMAAQEQALRTKGVKASIDKVEGEDGLCRLCGKFQESVQHIVGMDYWLDNLMCNVPELIMCYHLKGIVQVYLL